MVEPSSRVGGHSKSVTIEMKAIEKYFSVEEVYFSSEKNFKSRKVKKRATTTAIIN